MWQEVLDALQKTNSNNFAKNQTASLSEQHNCIQPILSNTWALCEYNYHLSSAAVFPQVSLPTDVVSSSSSMQQSTIVTGNLNLFHAAWKSCINLFIQ